MKTYTFEYTKQGVAYLLFLIMFGLIPLFILVFSSFLRNYLVVNIAISIVLAVIFFLFNKHRIKRIGKAELSGTGVVFELSEAKHIAFSELKYYYIYDGKNGIDFRLGLLDGTQLMITANNNFCEVEEFKTLLADLQSTIEEYKVENKGNIIHLESIVARKNTVYVLSFFQY